MLEKRFAKLVIMLLRRKTGIKITEELKSDGLNDIQNL